MSRCKRRVTLEIVGVFVVVGLAFAAQASAQWVGGPVLIGGDETDSQVLEGSQSGKAYAKLAFDFLGQEVTNGNNVVVCLGCNFTPTDARFAFEDSFDASGLPGPAPGLGWTRVSLFLPAHITAFFDGTGEVNVNNTGIIYLPSRAPDDAIPCCERNGPGGPVLGVFGGITQAQLDLVNTNKVILKDFVKGTGGVGGGGGLFTHQLKDMDFAYDWLTDPVDGLVPEIRTDVTTDPVNDLFLHLTCDAKGAFFSGITPVEVDLIVGGHTWHTRFEDKPGFTDLGGLTPVVQARKDRFTGVAFGEIIVLGAPLPPAVPGSDCNANGISDFCEADCNLNGLADECDIAAGSPDCDGNGVLDECNADCNSNGVPDDCDIQDCPAGDLSCVDCNADGALDGCEIQECVAGDPSCTDCNNNLAPDECDIQGCPAGDLSCADCNANRVLDGCEPGCNANPIPDDCRIQNCSAGDLSCADCDGNLVPDECDPDCDANGVPDVCDVATPPVLPAPPHDIRKNRFVSFAPNNCINVAFKIELLNRTCSTTDKKCMVDADCKVCVGGGNPGDACDFASACNGGSCEISGETCDENNAPVMLGWVNEPCDARELDNPPVLPQGTWTSRVVDSLPEFRTWMEPVVHIGDCFIAPAQTYAISATADGVTFSDPLFVATNPKPPDKEWGDLVGNFSEAGWSDPNGIVGVDDMNAILKFILRKPAPHITRIDLAPEAPNFLINAVDIGIFIKAFQNNAYPPPCTFPNQTDDPTLCQTRSVYDCESFSRDPLFVCSSSGPPSLFTLVPNNAYIEPDGTVRVDVYVDDVANLGSYDIALEVTGGTSGELTLVEVVIEKFCVGGTDDGKLCVDAAGCASPGACTVRSDYVFASGGNYEALESFGGRIANAKGGSGVAVTGSGYLGTYVYQACGCAAGDFTIAMKPGDDVTFINNGDGMLLPSTPDQCTAIGVGYDCFDAADCDPITCQTATCVSNECSYTYEVSGTSCDDGEFCTKTDTCDGSGLCVGTGTPCNRPPSTNCCEVGQTCTTPPSPCPM